MSDENVQKEVEVAPAVKAAADAIRDLFATIDPPSEVIVSNIYGGSMKLRSSVAARNQIRAMRELEKLSALTSTPELQEAAKSAGGGITGVIGFLVKAAMRDEVLDALCAAFAEAHPAALDAARADAKADGVKGADKLLVADLFPVEEVVQGLVPFLLRLIQKAIAAISSLTSPQNP